MFLGKRLVRYCVCLSFVCFCVSAVPVFSRETASESDFSEIPDAYIQQYESEKTNTVVEDVVIVHTKTVDNSSKKPVFQPITSSKNGYIVVPQPTRKLKTQTVIKEPQTVPQIEDSKELPAETPAYTCTLAQMQTSWGFGARENKYNPTIFKAVNVWNHKNIPLHPLLLKSLIATESAFDPLAVSYTGAMGLVQMTPETSRRFGLNWTTARDPQYAVPAGVKVLAEKAKAIADPGNYHKIMGLPPEKCPYASKVAQAYQKLGEPNVEQYWHLMLAAYNGGGGTILRAMAVCWNRGLDPRVWENLVGNPNNHTDSPLFLACKEIYGWGAANKYRELSAYPVKVLKYYRAEMKRQDTLAKRKGTVSANKIEGSLPLDSLQ